MDIRDLHGFSEPATKLVERCSDALGAIAHPYQLVRVAKAEAKAAVIKAQSEVEVEKVKALGAIEVSEVQNRALARLVHEEGKKQQNIEDVVAKALPEVKDDAKPEAIDEDWLFNFFDKCRLVSDDEMQFLWGKILAGEANEPGTYSKRTLNFLQSLSKDEAAKFQLLCRFSVDPDGSLPAIYDIKDEIYKQSGLLLTDLNNLQSFGLIVHSLFDYLQQGRGREFFVSYFSTKFFIRLPEPSPEEFIVGQVLLTGLGRQLARLCNITPIEGFADYLTKKWSEFKYEVTPVTAEEQNG